MNDILSLQFKQICGRIQQWGKNEENVKVQFTPKWIHPLFQVAFDVVNGSVSKAGVGRKWEEKQQWIKDLKR